MELQLKISVRLSGQPKTQNWFPTQAETNYILQNSHYGLFYIDSSIPMNLQGSRVEVPVVGRGRERGRQVRSSVGRGQVLWGGMQGAQGFSRWGWLGGGSG